MPARSSGERPEARVASILSLHALIFDEGGLDPGLGTGEGREYRDLAAQLAPGHGPLGIDKVDRIASVLEAHRLMFAEGIVASDPGLGQDVDELLAWLRSQGGGAGEARSRQALVPANLGRVFHEKGLGLPLFGPWRPSSLPPSGGYCLVYRGPESGLQVGIEAFPSPGPGRIGYRGRSAVIDSAFPRIFLALRRRASEGERVPPWPRMKGEVRSFSRWEALLASRAVPPGPSPIQADPGEGVFAYFFLEEEGLETRMASFLADLLCGIFGLPFRAAESLAADFSGRLPGR